MREAERSVKKMGLLLEGTALSASSGKGKKEIMVAK
jgi:hypothetical protein